MNAKELTALTKARAALRGLSFKDSAITAALEAIAEAMHENFQRAPFNDLPNGLTLLQVNPDCAVRLDCAAKDHGWLYIKGADGQWVTSRKLTPAEIETAWDQATDMAVLQGTKVRVA